MTSLTSSEIRKNFSASSDEINKYLQRKGWPTSPKNRLYRKFKGRASRAIMSSKIKRAIGHEFSEANTVHDWEVVYGRVRKGGAITFLHDSHNNQYLHIILTVACHEIHNITKVIFDDEEIHFSGFPGWSTFGVRPDGTINNRWADQVYISINWGTADQSAIQELIDNCPDQWNSLSTQSGRAHVYLLMKWEATVFPSGIPDIMFEIEGKPVYDPRSDSTAYSQNSALITADYMNNSEFGYGVPYNDMVTGSGEFGSLSDAADVCDETVNTIVGTEPRYTANGFFSTQQSHEDTIRELLTSMGGTITGAETGALKFFPAAYIEPTLTLTEKDLRGPIKITTRISRRDNFNAVRGTYVNPLNKFLEDDFPAVRNSRYRDLDGGEELFEDITLPYTQSPYTAQRLAKIQLEEIRQGIVVEALWSLKAFQLERPCTVKLTLSRFGWVEKIFRVEDLDFMTEDGDGGSPVYAIFLILRETASGIYEHNEGEETRVDLAPNSYLPNAFDSEPPTGIEITSGTTELYTRADGTIFSRMKVSWDTMSDAFISSGGHIWVRYKQTTLDDNSWSYATRVPGDVNFTHILDVQDGALYDVQLQSIGAAGTRSAWTTSIQHRVVGKQSNPSKVLGLHGELDPSGVMLHWDAVSDLDVKEYEVRYGSPDVTWEEGIFLGRSGSTKFQTNIKIKDPYVFMVKARDTSANESEQEARLPFNVNGPARPIVNAVIDGVDVVLSWPTPESLFPIDGYEIYYSATMPPVFETSISYASTDANSIRIPIAWSGVRYFWARTRDIHMNRSDPYLVSQTIQPPGRVQGLSSDVIDNNILLKWNAPTLGSLPIDHYRVYKGDAFSGAILLGEVSGTFSARFELLGGTYTYWIAAVDTAGNVGAEANTTAIIQPPSDFLFIQSGDPQDQTKPYIDPGTGQGTRFVDDGDRLIMPINELETWTEHFENNGFTCIQDAVDAGLTHFIQPVPLAAYWTRVLDYERIVESALITLEFSREDFDGTPTILTSIAYSEDGENWVTAQGQQVYAQNFQYVRITIQIGAFGEQSGEAMGNIGLTYP